MRAILEAGGRALSVGRAFRIVPDRTRVVVEARDRGCRVPGCPRSRWLQVHHIVHWEDGGATDTDNLIALCSRHHRAHHRGDLGIEATPMIPTASGSAMPEDDHWAPCGRPAPPTEPPPTGTWTHPTGERLYLKWVQFRKPPEARPDEAVAPPAEDQPEAPEPLGGYINLDDPIFDGQRDDVVYAG